jgi:hypothetical protein
MSDGLKSTSNSNILWNCGNLRHYIAPINSTFIDKKMNGKDWSTMQLITILKYMLASGIDAHELQYVAAQST